jgi:hypothetical protein
MVLGLKRAAVNRYVVRDRGYGRGCSDPLCTALGCDVRRHLRLPGASCSRAESRPRCSGM